MEWKKSIDCCIWKALGLRNQSGAHNSTHLTPSRNQSHLTLKETEKGYPVVCQGKRGNGCDGWPAIHCPTFLAGLCPTRTGSPTIQCQAGARIFVG